MFSDAGKEQDADTVLNIPEKPHAVRIRNLSKRYRMYNRPRDRLLQMLNFTGRRFYKEFWALQDVSVTVRHGETVGIVGRNGSGKTTLLQLICGTLTPTSGSVDIDGRTAPLLELGSGFNPEYTGMENIYVNGTILGMRTAEIESKLESIVAFADIGEFVHQPVKTYSSGMYIRLAFAVAIHTDPQILIVDEILAVGDAAFQRKCIQRFYDLRNRGCTILFVSHDAYQVKAVCSKALYLRRGRAVMFGDAHAVVDAYVEDLQKGVTEPESPASAASPGEQTPLRITRVRMENAGGRCVDQIKSRERVALCFQYERLDPSFDGALSFVFNLYRQDGCYVSGATTLMEHMAPFPVQDHGEVIVSFPELPLTAGAYVWRVAVNDAGGMMVHAQAKNVCPFRVTDDFRSVGIMDLKREWTIR